MKKFLPVFALLLLLGACVTTSSGDLKFVQQAVIRGATISVADSQSAIKDAIGNPDKVVQGDWYFKGKTDDDPTYVINFQQGLVARIRVIEPKKK